MLCREIIFCDYRQSWAFSFSHGLFFSAMPFFFFFCLFAKHKDFAKMNELCGGSPPKSAFSPPQPLSSPRHSVHCPRSCSRASLICLEMCLPSSVHRVAGSVPHRFSSHDQPSRSEFKRAVLEGWWTRYSATLGCVRLDPAISRAEQHVGGSGTTS